MVGGVLRLALAVAAVLGVVAGAVELGLRAAGAGPRAAAELSHVVPDGWTGFRLRPGVSGQEAFVTNDLGMHAPRSYTLAPPPGVAARRRARVVRGVRPGHAASRTRSPASSSASSRRPATARRCSTSAPTPSPSSTCPRCCRPTSTSSSPTWWWWWSTSRSASLAGPPSARRRRRRTRGSRSSVGGRRSSSAAPRRAPCSALFDDPRPARRWIRRTTGLPLRPRPRPTPRRQPEARIAAPRARGAHRRRAARPRARRRTIRAYEERRERELAAPLAAMAAFCRREVHRPLLRDALRPLLRSHRGRAGAHERPPLPRGGGPRPRQRARRHRRRGRADHAGRPPGGRARLRPRDRHAGSVTRLVAPDLARLHRRRSAPQPRGERGPRQAHRGADRPGPRAAVRRRRTDGAVPHRRLRRLLRRRGPAVRAPPGPVAADGADRRRRTSSTATSSRTTWSCCSC